MPTHLASHCPRAFDRPQVIAERHFTTPLVLHGAMSRDKRDAAVRRFQSDPSCQVFLISLKAGGVGLNLTAASHVIHYE